jgi:hypothetical protein
MKFKYIFFAMALFVLAGVFVYYNKRDLGIRSGAQTYTFSQLDAKEAALVRFRGEALSKIATYTIPFDEILDEHYGTLVRKKDDVLLASALEEFGLKTKAVILVGRAKPNRKIAEICNQFGFRCPSEDQLRFEGPQNYLLKIDNDIIKAEQVKAESIVFKAAHSEILDYLISRINEKIRARSLYFLAKEKNQSVQEYVNQNIIREDEVLQWAQKASAAYSSSSEEQKLFSRHLYQQHKDRLITDYLINNFVQKPIVVNIQRPQFNFEARWEWTPFFGMAPRKNSVHVVLFYDYFTQASRNTLKMLLAWREKKIDFTVGLRPSYPESDRMQGFLTEYLFCAWLKNPDDYWKLLESFTTLQVGFTEEQVNGLAMQAGVKIDPVKKCVIAREAKDVVDYHLKTAQFLRLYSLPTTFIGNEVRVGPLDAVEFERILNRQ